MNAILFYIIEKIRNADRPFKERTRKVKRIFVIIKNRFHRHAHLNARFAKVDAKAIGIATVVFDQLLKRSERGASRDEESALV